MMTQSTDLKLARSGEVTSRNFHRLGFERLSWGVYGHRPDTSAVSEYEARRLRFLTMVRASLASYEGSPVVLHGATALQMLGVALPAHLEDWETCHVVVPRGKYRPTRQGVVGHRVRGEVTVWRLVGGLPGMHPVDHWAQLRDASRSDLIEVGDGLVRRQHPLLTIAQMDRRLRELAGAPGVKSLRRAMLQVLPGTDSIYETRTRLIMTNAGLPCPKVNPAVRAGWRTYHLDMAYLTERIGIEFDGRGHGQTDQIDIDAERRRHLQDEGWLIINVTAKHLIDPTEFIRSVERALVLRAR